VGQEGDAAAPAEGSSAMPTLMFRLSRSVKQQNVLCSRFSRRRGKTYGYQARPRGRVISLLAPVGAANQATRHGCAYFTPSEATSPSAPSAALSVVAPPVEGAYPAPGIGRAQELR
jgi:hypothetical protein